MSSLSLDGKRNLLISLQQLNALRDSRASHHTIAYDPHDDRYLVTDKPGNEWVFDLLWDSARWEPSCDPRPKVATPDNDICTGDVVVVRSGSPKMTVSYTFVDDRYDTKRQYAKCVYFNEVSGKFDEKSVAVNLLRKTDFPDV
jgi:uncharacterized protein YodC (DUF2158 family)